jgi:acyl-coenzyme A thioesterase PaaI-like protein
VSLVRVEGKVIYAGRQIATAEGRIVGAVCARHQDVPDL